MFGACRGTGGACGVWTGESGCVEVAGRDGACGWMGVGVGMCGARGGGRFKVTMSGNGKTIFPKGAKLTPEICFFYPFSKIRFLASFSD